MRRLPAVIVTASLAFAGLASSAAANHSWNGYHWARTANPFTVKLGDNVTSQWDGALRTAASDWSADTANNPLNTTKTPHSREDPTRTSCGPSRSSATG